MIILITIVHVIVCLFLIVVVLLQSGKAGDISGGLWWAGQSGGLRAAGRSHGALQSERRFRQVSSC